MGREGIFRIGVNSSELTEDLDGFISSLVRFFPNRFEFLRSGDLLKIEAGKDSLQVFHSRPVFPPGSRIRPSLRECKWAFISFLERERKGSGYGKDSQKMGK